MLHSTTVDKERRLLAAEGYLELKMVDDALAELCELTPELQDEERSRELFLAIYMMGEDWNKGADEARRLCREHPLKINYFIHAAYCLHETGDTMAAKEWLIRGPKSLMKHALFHYNMACYDAVLGKLDAVRGYLEKAFALDGTLRCVAASDKDLANVDMEGL